MLNDEQLGHLKDLAQEVACRGEGIGGKRHQLQRGEGPRKQPECITYTRELTEYWGALPTYMKW